MTVNRYLVLSTRQANKIFKDIVSHESLQKPNAVGTINVQDLLNKKIESWKG